MSDVNKTKTGTVTLANGVAEVRYKIQSPKLNKSARLACVVNDPMYLRKDDVVDLSTLPSGRSIDDITLVYTIDASKSGNVVTFTVKSNSTTNTTPVAITITEYRPGNPIGVIKTQEATVAMSNGTGTTTYTISQTQPTVDQKVEGKITNTPAVRTEVTVPKYVAPAPVPPTYPWVRVTVSNSSPAAVKGNITGTIAWGGFTQGYQSGIQARVEVFNSSGSRVSGEWTLSGLGAGTGAPISGSHNFSWPYDASTAGPKAKVEVYAAYGAMSFPNGSSVNGSNSRDYLITV